MDDSEFKTSRTNSANCKMVIDSSCPRLTGKPRASGERSRRGSESTMSRTSAKHRF
nr:hypothetical protein [uncultured bacterium]